MTNRERLQIRRMSRHLMRHLNRYFQEQYYLDHYLPAHWHVATEFQHLFIL